jgi:hypothetical protein
MQKHHSNFGSICFQIDCGSEMHKLQMSAERLVSGSNFNNMMFIYIFLIILIMKRNITFILASLVGYCSAD